MYTQDDTMTPKDRISDEMLQQLLRGSAAPKGKAEMPCPLCQSDPSCAPRDPAKWGLVGYPLGSVFAPLQSFDNLYDADTALRKGTLFSELYLPFMGESVASAGGCCHD